jgi:hypothetical protein
MRLTVLGIMVEEDRKNQDNSYMVINKYVGKLPAIVEVDFKEDTDNEE